MSNSPQKRGGPAIPFTSPKKVPLKGLFQDGIWHCNCDPRLPAIKFQVKKEGPNRGRWFYSCQQPNGSGCRFFLWDDDAAGREMRAVISNSRSEPDLVNATADVTTDLQAVESAAEPSNKWIQDLGKVDKDKFGEWSLSTEDQRKVAPVAQVAEQQRVLPRKFPETPRKAIRTDNFMTPSSKRKRDEDTLLTPATGGLKGDAIFNTPSSTNINNGIRDWNAGFGLHSPSKTPTPSRFRDATEAAEIRWESSHHGFDITEEVFELLKDQHLDEDTSLSIRQLLSKHALQISGIVKGRDFSRTELKAKEAKVAELQQKITALESERELDKTIIRHFKNDMAQSISSKRGRGQGRS